MTMKEEMFAVKNNKFWVPELDEVNVNCAEGEDEEENLETEIVERHHFYGKCGENLCLSSLIDNEEDSDKGFVHKLSLEI